MCDWASLVCIWACQSVCMCIYVCTVHRVLTVGPFYQIPKLMSSVHWRAGIITKVMYFISSSASYAGSCLYNLNIHALVSPV